MASPPPVATEPACQLIPEPSPPHIPVSDSYPRWVCSLPGLNLFPQLWYTDFPSGKPVDRCHPCRTENHCQQLDWAHSAQSLPSASPPAYRRFRVIGDAEPPGLPATFNIEVNS